jgi:hypothetical protein
MGQGFQTRTFPREGDAGSQVFFFRLGLSNTPSLNPAFQLASPAIGYTFQECLLDQVLVQQVAGSSVFANCMMWRGLGLFAMGSATAQIIAGVLQGQASGHLVASQGGQIIVDQDFAQTSGAPYTCGGNGVLILGDAGYWTQAGDHAIDCSGGLVLHQPFFNSEGVFYGTDGGTVCENGTGNVAGAVVLNPAVTAVNQFACSNSNFTCGGQTSCFGFNQGTGAFAGPTTCTFAHLDAALAATTGFGGHAVDPATGCTFRKA